MNGLLIKDWRKFDHTNPAHKKTLMRNLHLFVRASERPEIRAAFQHFTVHGDFPTPLGDIIAKFHLTDAYDAGWETLLSVRDYRGTAKTSFRILDVGSALVFVEVPYGDKAKIHKMAGEISTVPFVRYGAGLGWPLELFLDQDYWTIEDNAIAFRNKWLSAKAGIGYALIEAISAGQDQAWGSAGSVQATSDNYQAIRDMQTINDACVNILVDLKNKGYEVGQGTVFALVAPVQLKARVSRALGLLNASLAGSIKKGLEYNVTASLTTMLSATDTYYVGIPGIKNIVGIREDLTIYEEFDALTRSNVAIGWARIGGSIGDEQQIRRCATV